MTRSVFNRILSRISYGTTTYLIHNALLPPHSFALNNIKLWHLSDDTAAAVTLTAKSVVVRRK